MKALLFHRNVQHHVKRQTSAKRLRNVKETKLIGVTLVNKAADNNVKYAEILKVF